MASYRRVNGRQHRRGTQEWNQCPSFNNMQLQPHTQRGFVPALNPLMLPQMHVPIRPLANNFMYNGTTPSPWLVTPMQPPVFFPVDHQDPHLHKKILKQIDYYFSDDNLVKDIYLRQKMDEQGWVHVHLIASFKRVLCLTDKVQLILDAMRTSKAVEVRGMKMRKRNGWMRWPIPRSLNVDSFSTTSNSVSNGNRFQHTTVV